MQISLSSLAIIIGLAVSFIHVFGVVNPAVFGEWLKKFPRSMPLGVVLMLIGTAWFVANLNSESIADFASFKPWLLGLFAAVGVGTGLFVRDFLAVRGLAVVMLLLAKLTVDTARWADTDWRLVLVTWAYVLVAGGIWFTIYPWHLRDLIGWITASQSRVRAVSFIKLAFGIVVMVLGFTVFKGA